MSLFNNIVNFVQDFLNGTRDISSTIEEVKSGDSAPLGTTMVEGFKQTDQTTPTAPLAPPTNLNDSSTGLVDTNGILTEDAQLAKSMQPDGNTDSQLSNLQ